MTTVETTGVASSAALGAYLVLGLVLARSALDALAAVRRCDELEGQDG